MIKKLFLMFLLSSSAGMFSSQANAVFIDFESQANLEALSTQFVPDGLEINNAIVLESGISLNEIDFPPSSGVHAITGIGSGPISLIFVDPASQPYDFIGFHITTSADAAINIFDDTSSLLSTIPITPNTSAGLGFSYSLSGAILGQIDIANTDGSAFLLTLDDIEFNVSPVPLPAAIWLFGTALIGLGRFGGRKKTA